ncbi:aromatic amino acid exporter YddG [Marinobacter zhejiangensis]|uniref:Permease of the drug/metabolite transporter (DMT) superfamily n=1 Tax=Marinobacter zhejiangensis TaxID=488535 RepID=A0A1I4TL99_9GAMM|nr:EamA family transporter [Marinobacter zhejiangensis]SFM77401.1 Permease of the drug/metabolite transporter (DMT) superfamily [Marinobacter zhejiangensis]
MTRTNATLIGSTAIFLWGTLALLTRFTGGKIPEFQLMAMTFAIAFLLMALRWLRRSETGVRYLKQSPFAWLIGVGGLFGYHFCYFKAMTLAPAVEVSLLAYLWPLLIVLLSSLLPGETLRHQHIVGAILSVLGCWMLIGWDSAGFQDQYLTGYLVALGCALIWSSYSVLSRLVRSVPTDAVGWFCLVTALLALACHWQLEETVWPQSLTQWLGVIGLGLGPVGVAFFTWDYGIKHGNLQLLGTLAYSAPLISVVLLVLAGEAEASWTLLIASLAIVGGSLIAGWQWRRRNVKTTA